jgi:hypothetical protein
MKHDFQIGQVIAPIGSPRGVKYVVIDTQPGAYSMYNLKDGYLVATAPMLDIDKDYVAVGKYVSGAGEVEDGE